MKGFALGVAEEVPTELAQQVIERAQAGLPLYDDEAIREYVDVIVASAAVGGTIKSTTSAAFGKNNTKEKNLEDDLKADALDAEARQKEYDSRTPLLLPSEPTAPKEPLQIAGKPTLQIEDKSQEESDKPNPAAKFSSVELSELPSTEATKLRNSRPAFNRDKPASIEEIEAILGPKAAIREAGKQHPEGFRGTRFGPIEGKSFEQDHYDAAVVAARATGNTKLPAIQASLRKAGMKTVPVQVARDVQGEMASRGVIKKQAVKGKPDKSEFVLARNAKFDPVADLEKTVIQHEESIAEMKREAVRLREESRRAAQIDGNSVPEREKVRYDNAIAEMKRAVKAGQKPKRPTPPRTGKALARAYDQERSRIEAEVLKSEMEIKNARKRQAQGWEGLRVPDVENVKAIPGKAVADASRVLPAMEAATAQTEPDVRPSVQRGPEKATDRPLVDGGQRTPPLGTPPPSSTTEQAIEPPSPQTAQLAMKNIGSALRRRLLDLNLKDVDLSVQNIIDSNVRVEGYEQAGENGRRVIAVAMEAVKPGMSETETARALLGVLNHEVLHSLRSLGLLSNEEWTTLVSVASTKQVSRKVGNKTENRGYTFLDRAKRIYANQEGYSQDRIQEEAVAEMFRAWTENRKGFFPAKATTIFQKIVRFFKAVYGGYSDAGYATAESIFADTIETGDIGLRKRGGGNLRGFTGDGTGTLYSLNGVFYSPTLKAIENMKLEKAPPAQWLAMFKAGKIQGAKKAEMDWIGLEQWLEGKTKAGRKSISKYQIASYVSANQVVLTEDILDTRARFPEWTEKGGDNYREVLLQVPDMHQTGKNEVKPTPEQLARWNALNEKLDAIVNAGGRFDSPSYTLLSDERERLAGEIGHGKSPYIKEQHFRMNENIVVHARLKDRVADDGGKLMWVEEIQSDLENDTRKATSREDGARAAELDAQLRDFRDNERGPRVALETAVELAQINHWDQTSTAPEEEVEAVDDQLQTWLRSVMTRPEMPTLNGYSELSKMIIQTLVADPSFTDALADYKELRRRWGAVRDERDSIEGEPLDPSVPESPFTGADTYTIMAKRLLNEAVKNGYDYFAWTPGYMQARRWQQSYQLVYRSLQWWPVGQEEHMGRTYGATRAIGMVMEDKGNSTIYVNADGNVVYRTGEVKIKTGKPLASHLGGKLAAEIMSSEKGKRATGPTAMGTSGFSIAYDGHIKRAISKILKPYGVEPEIKPYAAMSKGGPSISEASDMLRYGEEATMLPRLQQAFTAVGIDYSAVEAAYLEKFNITKAELERKMDQDGIMLRQLQAGDYSVISDIIEDKPTFALAMIKSLSEYMDGYTRKLISMKEEGYKPANMFNLGLAGDGESIQPATTAVQKQVARLIVGETGIENAETIWIVPISDDMRAGLSKPIAMFSLAPSLDSLMKKTDKTRGTTNDKRSENLPGRDARDIQVQGRGEGTERGRTRDASEGPAPDDAVTEHDLRGLTSEKTARAFLARPGWATITGTQEGFDPDFAEQNNARANARLREELVSSNIPFVTLTGRYLGEDQGISFLIIADTEKAVRLGKTYEQESILTSDGLVFTNDLPRVPSTGEIIVGTEATLEDNYSEGSDVVPFSLRLDFGRGPGNPVIPPGFTTIDSRPQLPIRTSDGMVELHHWTDRELTSVDPSKAGTGPLKGAERAEGIRRSFFGINPRQNLRDRGTGYVKEPGLGKNHYIATIDPNRLYPFFADPDGLVDTLRPGSPQQRHVDYILAIRDAGVCWVLRRSSGS
jgi:hypothetical protein